MNVFVGTFLVRVSTGLKLREREKLFSFFSSDSGKFVIKRGYLFYNEGSYHVQTSSIDLYKISYLYTNLNWST